MAKKEFKHKKIGEHLILNSIEYKEYPKDNKHNERTTCIFDVSVMNPRSTFLDYEVYDKVTKQLYNDFDYSLKNCIITFEGYRRLIIAVYVERHDEDSNDWAKAERICYLLCRKIALTYDNAMIRRLHKITYINMKEIELLRMKNELEIDKIKITLKNIDK